ncbi:PH domain-containing protein [Sciscionella marina]|uniref:PH domain-containing protein n=1 Tax=Sciscionella marina TaxID=508770 RepID=UPI0003733EA5
MSALTPRDADDYLLASERRVIRVRRHWACLAWEVFETAALVAVAVMLSYIVDPEWTIVQNILWYGALLVILRFAYQVVDWWVEQIIVTDKRVMLTTGVFTTQVAMMPIGKVTDLTYERSANGRAFGYGTLVVESAGQIQALNRIEFLPRPEEVYDAISELVFGDKKEQEERFSMRKAEQMARKRRLLDGNKR